MSLTLALSLTYVTWYVPLTTSLSDARDQRWRTFNCLQVCRRLYTMKKTSHRRHATIITQRTAAVSLGIHVPSIKAYCSTVSGLIPSVNNSHNCPLCTCIRPPNPPNLIHKHHKFSHDIRRAACDKTGDRIYKLYIMLIYCRLLCHMLTNNTRCQNVWCLYNTTDWRYYNILSVLADLLTFGGNR